MSRKHPFPELDRAIARRLGVLRVMSVLSREDLARRARLARDVIFRIEAGRMPLRYGEAEQLLPALQPDRLIRAPINPLWIAYGTEPIQLNWPFFLPTHRAIGLDFKTPFSAFVTTNRTILEALAKDPPEVVLPESWLFPYWRRWAVMRSDAVRLDSELGKFGAFVEFSARRLAPNSLTAANVLREFKLAEKERLLTTIPFYRNIQFMKSGIPDMPQLLKRLRDATARRGMKGELARAMKVKLPRISEWLGEDVEPSGQTTLRLFRWVFKRENQSTKNGVSAETPAPSKTRHQESSYEKPKSGPNKR